MKNRLKVLRAERDWTQAQLATELEVSRRAVNAIEKGKFDPSLPLGNVTTLATALADRVAPRRLHTFLLAAFAGLALFLALVGIYGVIAQWVGERTREIGVRMALGARGQDVLTLVLRHGAMLTMMGIGVGVAGVLALNRLLSQFLFGVSATDPLTITVVSTLLAGVAVLAVIVPARRAARIDPIAAVRYE